MNACRQGMWALLALFALAAWPAQAQTVVEYIHTDALGSVVAVTGANRAVIERREYEPFGAQLTPTVQDGPGYTGHVQDAATGLVYMQQRYYDPGIGMMLSVDPVTAYEQPITNFCRYCYARNNPYKFTDPDGRQALDQSHKYRATLEMAGGDVDVATSKMSEGLGQGLAIAAGVVVAAPVVAEVGMAALANPGAVATATNVAAEVAGVTGTAGAGAMAARALSAEGRALANAQPVANALKNDSIHRSASFVRQEAAQRGTHTALVGGDGVTRTLTQIPGGLNGQVGRFEYIVDQAGNLTHQRFVSGGSINGVPNRP